MASKLKKISLKFRLSSKIEDMAGSTHVALSPTGNAIKGGEVILQFETGSDSIQLFEEGKEYTLQIIKE